MMNPGGPGWNDPPKLSYEIHSQTTSRKNLLTKRVGLPDLKIPPESTRKNKDDATKDPGLPPPCHQVINERKDEDVISGLLFKESLLPPGNSAPPASSRESPPALPSHSPSPLRANKHVQENPKERSSLDSTGESFASEEIPQLSHGMFVPPPSQSSSTPTILNPVGHSPEKQATEAKNEDVAKIRQEEDHDQDNIDAEDLNVIKELKIIVEKCETAKIFSKQVGGNITKKIEILEKRFDDLPNEVKLKMKSLTKYLMMKKYEKAWDVHVSLMCDYSALVIQWMVGVKRLISEAKNL